MADAKITIGGDTSELGRALAAGAESVRAFSASVQGALSTATKLAEVPLSHGQVNFSQQGAQVREFEQSSARLAVAMGSDQELIRQSLEATGVELGKKPQEVAAWTTQVGALTYSFAGAAAGLKGVTELATLTGRSASDFRTLAVELATTGKVAGDSSEMIGKIVEQANELKNAGGVAAFTDQIMGLSDALTHVSQNADMAKITATAGVLAQGIANPAAAQRVQQQAFGAVVNDPLRWERYLGHAITDDHGQVNDPGQVLREITEKTKQRYGASARRVLQLNFGAETGAALFNADFDKAAQLAGVAPSKDAGHAEAAYLATDAGKRDVAGATLAVSSRELLGSSTKLGQAADALERFAASNPISSTVITAGVSAGLSASIGSLGGAMSKSLASAVTPALSSVVKTLAPAGGSNLAAAGRVGGVIAVGAIAYEITSMLDQHFGWSDKLSGSSHEAFMARAREEDKTADADLAGRVGRQRQANSALHGLLAAHTVTGADFNAVQSVIQRDTRAVGDQERLEQGLEQGGMSPEAAQQLARAFAAEIQKVKLQVNVPNGPQEVAEAASQSSSAGNMSGG